MTHHLTFGRTRITTGGPDFAIRRFREWRLGPCTKYADTEVALLNAGQRLLNEKKPTAAALELFKLAIIENPNSFRAYYAAVAYHESGNKAPGVTNLKKALELNPKSYDVASYLRQVRK